MWLLNTSTAEQQFFADPNDVPGGYAILSHVWDKKEDSFQSVQEAVRETRGETTQKKEMEALKMELAALKIQVAAMVNAMSGVNAKANTKEDEAAKAEAVQGCASDMTQQALVELPTSGEH